MNARQIYVGVATAEDASTFARSTGSAVSLGDQKAIATAIINDINAHGGILGRRVVPVFHDFKIADTLSDPETATQAACADWTQDHKVFAVINSVTASNNERLYSCLKKAGTQLLLAEAVAYGQGLFAKYPNVYGPALMSVERLIPTWMDRLATLRYFTGWDTVNGQSGPAPTKVGLLTQDTYQHPLEDVETRELARHGIPVADRYVYSFSTIGTDMTSAVLRFRREGVTHVLLDNAAYGQFMIAAENQKYRPRYGLNTYHFPQANATGIPAAQLHGALGTGYLPNGDVDPAHSPPDVSPAVGRCRKLMRAAGQASEGIPFLVAQFYCEDFNALASGLAAGGSPNAASLARGLASLTHIESTLTFAERYGTGRQDSASAQRDLAYDDACSCFIYTSSQSHPS